jgi:carboxypeptidase Q
MKKQNRIVTVLMVSLCISGLAMAQTKEQIAVEKIYNESLGNGKSYEMLNYLSNRIGARMSGSPQAAAAVEWSRQVMKRLGADTVKLQEIMVPHWVRGEKEQGNIMTAGIPGGSISVPVCALGSSIGTGPGGISAEVIEVKNFDELKKLGKKKVKGKIVFYNRPMDPTLVSTFSAYGGAVDQRGSGAIEAAKLGAIAVIVRSMTLAHDDNPHTGNMHYDKDVTQIPAAAISTNGADLLSRYISENEKVSFYLKTSCENLAEERSFNVIGEITGKELPNEIVTVGGHLDSWDLGDGAHDDGTGIVESLEVLRLMKTLHLRPKRTIRVVMFMNEENGLRGGTKYYEEAKKDTVNKYYAALESDRGGFSPRGFEIDSDMVTVNNIAKWKDLFEPYGVYQFIKGGSGADIYQLKKVHALTMELVPDSQRYFDMHHCANDKFINVNRRELELGSATMAAMVYLLANQ